MYSFCLRFLPTTRYKCHKECVPHAPANCGFSEGKLRRAIDNTDIQNALGTDHLSLSTLLFMFHLSCSEFKSTISKVPFHWYETPSDALEAMKRPFVPLFRIASDSTSPTCSTPMSAPGSPAPHPLLPGYHFNPVLSNVNPAICVSESLYCRKYSDFSPFCSSDCWLLDDDVRIDLLSSPNIVSTGARVLH